MKQLLSLCLIILVASTLTACNHTIPEGVLQLSKESFELRHLQTRSFDTSNEKTLLQAGASVLQDLGYTLDESEVALGVIVGSKDRDATEAGQVAAAIFVAVLGGGSIPIDKTQKIRASLVTHPAGKGQIKLRVTFQRFVWNTAGQISKAQRIESPEIYQEFFTRLSKAVFLDAHEI